MEKVNTKNKKEAKDDQKIEEQTLKSLEDATTIEAKFSSLLIRHIELERTYRRIKQDFKIQEKKCEIILREKENLQRDHNKSVLMCDKLQEVCREQQKLIKSVKNESVQSMREEEERRKENQTKFQTSINEITQSLTKNNEENLKLRDHNIEMSKKLKYLAQQYATREEQLLKLNEQVQIENQLHEARLNKVQIQNAMEMEVLTKEKQSALEKLIRMQNLVQEYKEHEIELKQQLHLYSTKYDDFQSSLRKSNDIFTTYKTELEKVTKNTRKLEKEALDWKYKWEKSNASLIELVTEKKQRDDHALRCNKQVEQLQKLLRALQNERSHLYKVIRENNIECPPTPELPPEPEPLQSVPIKGIGDEDKMELMTKNCAELKETLATLQMQMENLNLKSNEAETPKTKQVQQKQKEEAAKKRAKKKAKSKNNKNVVIANEKICENGTPTNNSTVDIDPHKIGEANDNNNVPSPIALEDLPSLTVNTDESKDYQNRITEQDMLKESVVKDEVQKDMQREIMDEDFPEMPPLIEVEPPIETTIINNTVVENVALNEIL